MDLYNFFGITNTLFIFVSLYGVFSQLRTIWQRKKAASFTPAHCRQSTLTNMGTTTELLSLNQFSVSYLAYFSFFIYGYSIEPFNHYIVWPRLVATLLVGAILLELWRDRQTKTTLLVLLGAIVVLAAGMIGLVVGDTITDEGKIISTSIILIISLLIAQGYSHQIRLIIKSGSTGAVDLKMSQFILMMDISTICFALSMGLRTGWPLMVLAITSAITKLIIMSLFRWVRISDRARQRRTLSV